MEGAVPRNELAQVAVGRPLRGEFTYLIPPALRDALRVGQRLLVPFGRSKILGFYLGPTQGDFAGDPKKLRPIEQILDAEPALPPELLQLLRFAAAHYRYPLGEAIRSALPPGMSKAEEEQEVAPEQQWWAELLPGADEAALAKAPAQRAVLSYLLAVGGRAPLEELALAIPGAKASLRKLEAKGLARLHGVDLVPGNVAGLSAERPPALTAEQAVAVSELEASLEVGGFQPFLLHGVTGSGKTEVYLRASERALQAGKGALVLVPEIALTPQLVGRFRSRFGPKVAVLHSALKDKERLRHWQALRKGEVKLAVGVRSAIFAPVQDLGLLVVDEEHDPSFKQEEKLRYQARDLAVVRAKQAGATVVLGSATPSLETLENVRKGKYRSLQLLRRVDDRPMPQISLADLRLFRPRQPEQQEEGPILSSPLLAAMEETLAQKQQVILFLNRRGHSTFVVCQVCGTSLRCRNCDVCLTHHRSGQRLVCHYCGEAHPLPEKCPECSGALLLLGVGTERVEAELAERFPQARVARLDRDAVSSNERLTELLASFARREVDVLVGTQMVAKGHDFPGVTLVCAVMADGSLALPDFRAAERTFHLLTQVGGRAGRGKDPGRVLVQTYNPESQVLQRLLAYDFQGFSDQELAWRKQLGYPPYSRLAAVRLEGAHPDQTADAARLLGKRMGQALPPPSWGVRLLGPAPAPIARIRGKARWQLLLKGPTHAALNGPLSAAEACLDDLPSGVKAVIDVDPGAML